LRDTTLTSILGGDAAVESALQQLGLAVLVVEHVGQEAAHLGHPAATAPPDRAGEAQAVEALEERPVLVAQSRARGGVLGCGLLDRLEEPRPLLLLEVGRTPYAGGCG